MVVMCMVVVVLVAEQPVGGLLFDRGRSSIFSIVFLGGVRGAGKVDSEIEDPALQDITAGKRIASPRRTLV
jgi:hypothetical protein